jgi:hypothetical protein
VTSKSYTEEYIQFLVARPCLCWQNHGRFGRLVGPTRSLPRACPLLSPTASAPPLGPLSRRLHLTPDRRRQADAGVEEVVVGANLEPSKYPATAFPASRRPPLAPPRCPPPRARPPSHVCRPTARLASPPRHHSCSARRAARRRLGTQPPFPLHPNRRWPSLGRGHWPSRVRIGARPASAQRRHPSRVRSSARPSSGSTSRGTTPSPARTTPVPRPPAGAMLEGPSIRPPYALVRSEK